MERYLTVDEFMKQGFDSDDGAHSSSVQKTKTNAKTKGSVKRKTTNTEKKAKVMKPAKRKKAQENDQSESCSDDEGGYEDYKTTMSKLKDKDPEFYKYLSQNDQGLLDLDLSGSGSGSSEDESKDSVKKEKYHKPPDRLQVDSDESDYSDNEVVHEEQVGTKSGRTTITSKLIEEWRSQLQAKPKPSTVKTVMLAFRAAVEQASGDSSASSSSPFVVRGGTIFNSMVRLCLTSVLPALHKVLGLPPPTQKVSESHQGPDFNPKKSQAWTKMNIAVRNYLSDIIKMVTSVTETDIITVFLRHILYWVPFYIQYPKQSRLLLKKLVSLWSTGEESVRVLAFLCIIRVLRLLPNSFLDYFLKQMYLSYVNNSKFTSPNTWPIINFMKRSLVELYSLDASLAYQHAFIYIRQLAIHLRNAMTSNKKDANRVVFNWQYVHCLLLWSHLLATLYQSPQLAPLLYPLVQIILGVVNLSPTAKFLPLRFHLVRSLTTLSAETHTFVPVLALLVQVFEIVDFNKGHSTFSLRPMDFTCILKLSKSQLQENAFRDGCVQQVYELMMDYLNSVSHLIGSPELVFPAAVQIKTFLKNCKVGNYNRQMKQGLDKIMENSNFITDRRSRVTFGVSDFKAVSDWEKETKETGTPITKFYASWRKVKDQEILHSIASKDQGKEMRLPTIDRQKFLANKKVDKEEYPELFASGSEGDEPEHDFSLAMEKTEKDNKKRKTLSPKLKKKKQKK